MDFQAVSRKQLFAAVWVAAICATTLSVGAFTSQSAHPALEDLLERQERHLLQARGENSHSQIQSNEARPWVWGVGNVAVGTSEVRWT